MLAQPGLYVHFPWCVKKCPYCDFNSHPLRETQDQDYQASYHKALQLDWNNQQHHLAEPLNSIFFGGGTPSLFEPQYIEQLTSVFPLAPDCEVTLETNPGTAEYANFNEILAAGINRISFGVQSFNNTHLEQLGRIHNAQETYNAFAAARKAGFSNINLDLMWGLPNQTVEEALHDLRKAIELEPEHISWYQLTIEAKTEYARRPPVLPEEDLLLQIEQGGLNLLELAGYERYEVSAFAKPHRRWSSSNEQ